MLFRLTWNPPVEMTALKRLAGIMEDSPVSMFLPTNGFHAL